MLSEAKHLGILILSVLCALLVNAQSTYKLRKWNVPSGQYSGITPIGGDRYAVVTDKMDGRAGFGVWRVEMNRETAEILSVEEEGWYTTPRQADRDQEGVAFCPKRNTIFISGEADQQVLEHRLDGTLTGNQLRVPDRAAADKIQPNRGFEALCYDSIRACFWTTTESPLKADSAGLLRLLSFGTDLQWSGETHYILESPQAKNAGRAHYHGVVAMCAMPDGTLLVLEREARIARHYSGSRCWCRVFSFDPETGEKAELAAWKTRFTLFNTRMANYEGMCPGPTLRDGRQTVLLVSDAEGGYGRALWHLKDRLKVLIL